MSFWGPLAVPHSIVLSLDSPRRGAGLAAPALPAAGHRAGGVSLWGAHVQRERRRGVVCGRTHGARQDRAVGVQQGTDVRPHSLTRGRGCAPPPLGAPTTVVWCLQPRLVPYPEQQPRLPCLAVLLLCPTLTRCTLLSRPVPSPALPATLFACTCPCHLLPAPLPPSYALPRCPAANPLPYARQPCMHALHVPRPHPLYPSSATACTLTRCLPALGSHSASPARHYITESTEGLLTLLAVRGRPCAQRPRKLQAR